MLSATRTSNPRLTRDQKKADTRERLVRAAAAVFARRGYHAATVDEVADEAGFSIGALYSNFTGKQELFLAMLEEHFESQMAIYSDISSHGQTTEEKARGAADYWMRFLDDNPYFFPLFIEFWGLALRDPKLRDQFARRFRRFRDAMARLMQRDAAEVGVEIPDAAAEGLATAINAMGNGLALHMLIDPQAAPRDLFGSMMALIFAALEEMVNSGDARVDARLAGGGTTSQLAASGRIRKTGGHTRRSRPTKTGSAKKGDKN